MYLYGSAKGGSGRDSSDSPSDTILFSGMLYDSACHPESPALGRYSLMWKKQRRTFGIGVR